MREDQLERSLRVAAPRVSTAGVLDAVVRKRARRRTVRRVELGVLATVVVVALSLTVALVQTGDDTTRVVASGGARTTSVVALDPDQGYVRGPLLLSGSTLSLTAYDRDGDTFTFPPSRIVRIDDRTFREEGRTDLKAEVLSIADGEGARWAVTRNPKPANGLPDAFLKRITADGTVRSTLLPPGSDPVGNVAVGAGSVWIPLRDGVLRYDAANEQSVTRIDLAPAESRDVVVVNGAVWTTDGVGGYWQLASVDARSPVVPGSPWQVVGLATDGSRLLVLSKSPATGEAHVGNQTLPRRFTARRLFSAGGRAWVEGTVDGSPAVVLLGRKGPPIVLDGARDASFAWLRNDTVLAVSSGRLLQIQLGHVNAKKS